MSYTPVQPTSMFFDEADEAESVLPKNPEDIDTHEKYFPGEDVTGISTVYSRDHSIDSIMHQLGGYKLEVTYFLQLVDPNDANGISDTSVSTTLRQYSRIDKLILFMDSPFNQDAYENVTFDATIDAGISPTHGDVCIMFTGLGREAKFDVTNVVQKHYNNREVYTVTFKFAMFVDQDTTTYNDLIMKTVKEEVYDASYLTEMSSPVLTKQEFVRKIELREAIPTLVDYYLRSFLHPRARVFAPPTTGVVYTDTFLTEYLFKIINSIDNPGLMKVTRLNTVADDTIRYTFWDVLAARDINLLKLCDKNIGFMYASSVYMDPLTRSVQYLNIDYIVNHIGDYIKPVPPVVNELAVDVTKRILPAKDINDLSYVLSNNFYSGNVTSYTLLEAMVIDFLNNRKFDITSIDKLIEDYPRWTTMEQYYYIPIVITLIKDALLKTFRRY